jgi:outer membrane lipoprotein-sorting protein
MYIYRLADWSGTGDFVYIENGATVTITNIAINPTLADSLFATS